MLWKIFLIALPVFFVIDMIWLGLVARNFYADKLGFLMRENINWTAAIIFYLVFIFALVIFVIHPAVDKRSLTDALIYGALFGFVTYATYDLTNLATLKDWPLTVTLVDLVWGTVLASSVATITYLIAIKFLS